MLTILSWVIVVGAALVFAAMAAAGAYYAEAH
jgi:hypothetical protein